MCAHMGGSHALHVSRRVRCESCCLQFGCAQCLQRCSTLCLCLTLQQWLHLIANPPAPSSTCTAATTAYRSTRRRCAHFPAPTAPSPRAYAGWCAGSWRGGPAGAACCGWRLTCLGGPRAAQPSERDALPWLRRGAASAKAGAADAGEHSRPTHACPRARAGAHAGLQADAHHPAGAAGRQRAAVGPLLRLFPALFSPLPPCSRAKSAAPSVVSLTRHPLQELVKARALQGLSDQMSRYPSMWATRPLKVRA